MFDNTNIILNLELSQIWVLLTCGVNDAVEGGEKCQEAMEQDRKVPEQEPAEVEEWGRGNPKAGWADSV